MFGVFSKSLYLDRSDDTTQVYLAPACQGKYVQQTSSTSLIITSVSRNKLFHRDGNECASDSVTDTFSFSSQYNRCSTCCCPLSYCIGPHHSTDRSHSLLERASRDRHRLSLSPVATCLDYFYWVASFIVLLCFFPSPKQIGTHLRL